MNGAMAKDYSDILGVKKTASEEEIKKVVEYLKKQDAHELDTINLD